MELPRWVRAPHGLLRVLMPGFLFIAFGTAFFPGNVSGLTRTVVPNANLADLVLVTWTAWSIAIGLVYNLYWRGLYAILRPRPLASTVVGEVLERAGAPPTSPVERRAIYELLDAGMDDDAGRRRVERERAMVEYAYQATTITVLVGIFIAVWRPAGPLIAPNQQVLQGIAMAIGGGLLATWCRFRDVVVHRMELGTIRWADPETLTFMMQAHANLLAATGHAPPQAPPQAAEATAPPRRQT